MFSGRYAAARIPLVGLISQYNAAEPPPDPNLMPLLIKRG
jgi:NADPH-dependent curcumin reductase CurA